MSHTQKEQAILWRDEELGGLEILRATYVTHSFARHAHETFAIGLIEAGAGAFAARGTTYVARTSNIFVLHPGEVHTGYAAVPAGWTYRMLYPDLVKFQHLACETVVFARETPFFPCPIIEDERLRGLLLSLHALLERPSGRLEKEMAFYRVFTHLVSVHTAHPPQQHPTGREHRAIAFVRDYLHTHYDQAISLEQLASLVGLHSDYLIRAFHAHVGLPPHAYLTQIRVQQAKILLGQGMPPAQVALETGFADQSHLTRHFKRLVGVPPGHY